MVPFQISAGQADHQPFDVETRKKLAVAARTALFETVGFFEEEGTVCFLVRNMSQNVLVDCLGTRIEILKKCLQEFEPGLVDVIGYEIG